LTRLPLLLLVAILLAGCATSGRFYSRGERAARAGDWDAAVEYYRQAVQGRPNSPEYNIALERAMLNASRLHLDQARVFEAQGQLEDALREYRRASEFDPPNRQVAAKALEIERRIRDEAEAAQPRTTIAQLRAQARNANIPVLIAANEPVPGLTFRNTSLRDALNTLGMAMGVNITYESTYQDKPITIQLDNVTLEQALTQLMSSNQMFYKVVNPQTIMVIPNTPAKRQEWEDMVIRTFFISHADATELAQLLNGIIRVPNLPVQPQIQPNKAANTITVRASVAMADIIEKVIDANDNPRAEVVIDVQILEVDRTRTKQFGLDLGNYQVSAAFSPEASAIGESGGLAAQPFNANTITRGISTADFYLAVPSAVIRFLESDSETKLIAKPQLRGAEGQKITMSLGNEIPVPTTVFTPLAGGGASTNPLTSFTYRTIGVVVEMTPRVTPEGDIILDLSVENSTLGASISLQEGQSLPTFGSRKVTTRLRLRDGESNLLAGLLQETDRKDLSGVPGLLRLPILNKLLSANERHIDQTDIVMLLTPRIVRTQELTMADVSPIFIGTQNNIGLGGPPPIITPLEPEPAQPAPAPAAPATPLAPGGVGVPVVPPGSSPIPGTITVPAGPTPGSAAPAPQNAPPAAGAPAPAGQPQGAVTTTPPPAVASATTPATGGAQLVVTPPGTDFRVGGGPYTVAISATNAARLSAVSLTLTFNPSVVRVRTVQEGSFMRAGGANASFTPQVNAAAGRIDIAIVRSGDTTGVAGTGLLAAVLFDAVGGGAVNMSLTGTASAPGGAPLPVRVATVPAVTAR
jgi:general secretion pathway protein D